MNSGRRPAPTVTVWWGGIMPPSSLTPGAMQRSALMKCSGTFTGSCEWRQTRKSRCSTYRLYGCHWVSFRSRTGAALPRTMVSTEAWKASLRRAIDGDLVVICTGGHRCRRRWRNTSARRKAAARTRTPFSRVLALN